MNIINIKDYLIYKKINILNKLSNIKKLIKFINSIDIVESNDTIYINMDKSIVLNHNKHLIINGDGYMITKHSKTHINPDIKINILNTMDTIKRADIKTDLLRKQNLFSSLLKHKRIKTII